ncbi:DUF1758 domain-containing protein [Trichonephila clavipes]|nr:DUF1758 domain-containing protein [Trichonephila clavipes]
MEFLIPPILAQFSEHSSHDARVEFSKDSNESSKVLGLFWNSSNDTFGFQPSLELTPPLTKRRILSESSKIFDPLGLLSPCTVFMKIFYQKLWLTKTDWDSPIPQQLTEDWLALKGLYQHQLPHYIASRGIDPKCLPDCKLWWQGPPWLRLETSSWPKAEYSCDEASDEEEIRSIKKQISLPPKSPLRSLHPFIDEHGLVRVGGRLQNSQLRFNSKHPIILPSQHSISELSFIKEQHIAHLHAGPTLLAHVLRQSHWIVGSDVLSVSEELPSTHSTKEIVGSCYRSNGGLLEEGARIYLILQPRKKWQDAQPNLKEDDIVLIKGRVSFLVYSQWLEDSFQVHQATTDWFVLQL